MKTLLIVLLAILCFGCQDSQAWQPTPAKQSPYQSDQLDYDIDFLGIFSALLKHGPTEDILGRDPVLHPENIYGAILNLDFAKLETTFIGKRKIFLLPKISQKRVDYVISKIPPSLHKMGFEIFSPDYWQSLKELIDSGSLQVGVIEFVAGENINGIYSNAIKVIGVDALAVVGTLSHELRHHHQYLEIDGVSEHLWGDWSSQCVAAIHRAFAETDAASHDLPFWSGVLTSLEVEDLASSSSEDRLPQLPQFYYFEVSVDYPKTVLQALVGESRCSKRIRTWGSELMGVLQPPINALKDLAKEIEFLTQDISLAIIRNGSACLQNKESSSCADLTKQKNELKHLHIQFEKQILEVSERRYPILLEFFEKLPKWYRQELVEKIPGAYSFANGGHYEN